MTLAEIKAAIDAGESVKWANGRYDVIRNSFGQYLIICDRGDMYQNVIGLTWRDGVTLNGEEAQFYIAPKLS